MFALLEVREGFEAATAALFDGELAAPELPAELAQASGFAAGWRDLMPLSPAPLPEGAQPLSAMVAAPSTLDRPLARAGWVEDDATGWRLQRQQG